MEDVKTHELVLEAEDITTSEIKKFNLADSRIAQLKKEFGGIRIAGLEDKHGYKTAKEALAVLRPLRTGIEKKRKDLKEDYLRVGRAIDAEAKRLTGLLLEIEDPIKAEVDRIDAEKEAEKKAAAEALEQKINQRINLLISLGMAFDGAYYRIGETVTVGVVDVRAMSDETFSTLTDAVKAEAEKIAAEKAAKEAAEKAERERMKAEQKRLADEAEKIQRELQELERMKAELQAQKDKAEREEKERLEAIERERIKDEAAKQAIAEHEARIKAEHEAQLRAEKEAEQRRLAEEKRRAELAPDKEKLMAYFEAIKSVPVPNIADKEMNAILYFFYAELSAMITKQKELIN